jgi:hypothetical protein
MVLDLILDPCFKLAPFQDVIVVSVMFCEDVIDEASAICIHD